MTILDQLLPQPQRPGNPVMIIQSPMGDKIGWIEQMFLQEKKTDKWMWEFTPAPEEKKDSLPVMLHDYQMDAKKEVEKYFTRARARDKSYFAYQEFYEFYGKMEKLEQVAKLEEFVRRPLVVNPSNWVIEAQRRSELTLPARGKYLSRSIMTRSFEHAGMGIHVTPSIPTVSGQFKKPEGKLLKQSDKNKYWSEPWTKQRIRLS